MAQIHFSRNYPGVAPKAPAIPAGGTGTTKYLREDGTWAEPPYLYYELANEITIPVDGNEAIDNHMISDTWDSTKTYYNGDLVIYNNQLWKYDKVGTSGTSAVPSDSNAVRTSLSNEINTKNNFGNDVDLESYTTNAFTCPTDGYVCMQPAYARGSRGVLVVNGATMAILRTYDEGYTEAVSLFVKKGMQVSHYDGDAFVFFVFKPLI